MSIEDSNNTNDIQVADSVNDIEYEFLGHTFKLYGTIEEPLFLAKDVAECIDYSKTSYGAYNVNRMVNCVDDDEKMILTLLISGQNRQVWMLTENGLYDVLMQSRKPKAKEFKKKIEKILANLRDKINDKKEEEEDAKMSIEDNDTNSIRIADSINDIEYEFLGHTFKLYGTMEEPLFLAKDVAECIEHSNPRMMLKTVDEDEKKCVNNPYALKGQQEQWFLTENGLYEVLMQSRKPIAKEFKKKIKEILKTIRMTGRYSVNNSNNVNDEQFKSLNERIESVKEIVSTCSQFMGTVTAVIESQGKIVQSLADLTTTQLKKFREASSVNSERIATALEKFAAEKRDSNPPVNAIQEKKPERNEAPKPTEYTLSQVARELKWLTPSGIPHFEFLRDVLKVCGVNVDTRREHEDEYSRCVIYHVDEQDMARSCLYLKEKALERLEEWGYVNDWGHKCKTVATYKMNGPGHKAGDIKNVYYEIRDMNGQRVPGSRQYNLREF